LASSDRQSRGLRPRSAGDAYVDFWTKAAALLQSIVNNHALVDGNQRLGWLATAVFLDLNGVNISAAGNDDVFDLVMAVASSQLAIGEIATRLSHLVPSLPE
jgi:death-on-curing protein